jgi:hypothetical protein
MPAADECCGGQLRAERRWRAVSGLVLALFYADPGLTLPGSGEINHHQERDQAGLVSCAQLAQIPAHGRGLAGAAVAAVDTNTGDTNLAAAQSTSTRYCAAS